MIIRIIHKAMFDRMEDDWVGITLFRHEGEHTDLYLSKYGILYWYRGFKKDVELVRYLHPIEIGEIILNDVKEIKIKPEETPLEIPSTEAENDIQLN